MGMGWGPNQGVVSFEGRVGNVVAIAGDYDSTQITDASTAGGPTVAASFNTLSAAVAPIQPTIIEQSNFVLGATPNYATLLTLPLTEGKAYDFNAELSFWVGPGNAMRSAEIHIQPASARRPAGAGAQVSSPASVITGNINGLAIAWTAVGNNAVLGVRANGGPTAKVKLIYILRELENP